MLMPASAMPRSRSCSFHAKRTYARTTFRPQGGARARTALARVVHSVFRGVPGLSAGPPCHHAAKTGANISYRLMSAVVRRARSATWLRLARIVAPPVRMRPGFRTSVMGRYDTFSIVYRSRKAPPVVAHVSPLGQ